MRKPLHVFLTCIASFTVAAIAVPGVAAASLPVCKDYGTFTAPAPYSHLHASFPTDQHNGSTQCKLSLGDKGAGVFVLQAALNKCHGGFTVDAIYGTKTRDAVKWIQAVYGLTADGIYGPQTWLKGIAWPYYDSDNVWRTCAHANFQ